MRPNRIKQQWSENKPVTLGWLSIANSFTAELMARQGFDALCIDLQHGTMGMTDLLPMLQAISQTETLPIVRVPWNDAAPIMKALDLGAMGIIVPMINTAEDAAKAVAACRYMPTGMRSAGPVRALQQHGSDYFTKADGEIIVFAMIETKDGLANLDAIAATPGLDALYIGPADLSYALGLPPKADNTDPLHMETCNKILAAARAGITRIVLPAENERDLEDIPADVREKMEFNLVESMDEVVIHALDGTIVPLVKKLPEAAVESGSPIH